MTDFSDRNEVLVIFALGLCWLQAVIDGKVEITKVFRAGLRERLAANQGDRGGCSGTTKKKLRGASAAEFGFGRIRPKSYITGSMPSCPKPFSSKFLRNMSRSFSAC